MASAGLMNFFDLLSLAFDAGRIQKGLKKVNTVLCKPPTKLSELVMRRIIIQPALEIRSCELGKRFARFWLHVRNKYTPVFRHEFPFGATRCFHERALFNKCELLILILSIHKGQRHAPFSAPILHAS